MKRITLAIVSGICTAAVIGCGASSTDGEIKKADIAPLTQASQGARKAGGDWDKMSPADQQKWIDRSHGNVEEAKRMAKMVGSKKLPPGVGPQ